MPGVWTNQGTDISDADAAVGDVLASKTFYAGVEPKKTGTMPNIGQQNITPTTSNQSISAGYHDGTGVVDGDADLIAANIKTGISIFGVAGSLDSAPTSVTSGSFSDTHDSGTVNISYKQFGKLYFDFKATDQGGRMIENDLKSRNRIASKLGVSISSSGSQPLADGDDGVNVIFYVDHVGPWWTNLGTSTNPLGYILAT